MVETRFQSASNEVLNKYASFNIDAFILMNSPLKLIIGLPSIRDLILFSMFSEHVGLTRLHSSSVVSALSDNSLSIDSIQI